MLRSVMLWNGPLDNDIYALLKEYYGDEVELDHILSISKSDVVDRMLDEIIVDDFIDEEMRQRAKEYKSKLRW